MFKVLFDKIKKSVSKIKSGNFLQYLLIVVVVIILLTFLSGNLFASDSSESEKTHNDLIETYVTNLENKLANTLSKVEGAGEVSVVITVESGMETVIAKKTIIKKTADGIETEETPILVNGKTVTLKEVYPKITGVLIVAQGANKISVLNKIQQATVSLFDIEINQIEILTMK